MPDQANGIQNIPDVRIASAITVDVAVDDDASLRQIPPPDKAEVAPPWTRKQIVTLIVMCTANSFSALYFSLLAPFYAPEAKKKGATFFEAGLVLGCFPIIVLITSPIFGRLMKTIGTKFMFVTGILVAGSCAMLFGVLEYCPNGTIYVVMCLLSRSLEACACAANQTASFTMSAHCFPGRTSTVVGLLQASGCAGLMAGPPLGGLLFTAGGFKMPFLVTGGLFFLGGVIAFFVLSPVEDNHEAQESRSPVKLLTHPAVWVVGFLMFAGQSTIGFIDVALSPQLKTIGVKSNALLGVIFLIPPGCVVILAPVYGWLTDRFGVGRILMVVGITAGCVAFFFLGPSPVLPLAIPRRSLWLTATSLAAGSIGWGCLVITFQEFVNAAKERGFQDNIATHGLISGVYNVFNSVGSFIGPVGGGFLLEKLRFEWSCTVFSGLIGLALVQLVFYFAIDRFILRPRQRKNCPKEDQKALINESSDRQEILPEQS